MPADARAPREPERPFTITFSEEEFRALNNFMTYGATRGNHRDDGQPAVIRSVYRDSGELYVVPDGIERFDCPRDWMVSPDLRGAWPDYAHGLRLDVFSDRIGWFRDMNQADDVRNAIEELTR